MAEDFDDGKSVKNELTKETTHTPLPSPLPDEITPFREAVFIFCACMTQLLTQAALAQTVCPFLELAEAFGVEDSDGEISWFTASYSLTVGTFILISGRLGDIYGYKRLYIIGYIWFSIFSLVCGFAGFTKSYIFFNAMRALQGIGPAITLPNAIAILGHYYPMGIKKNVFMCMFGGVAPVGFVIGAIFSGVITQLATLMALPSVFLNFFIIAITCVLVLVLGYFSIPDNIGNGKAEGDHLSIDVLGSLTSISGLILINYAWNDGPNIGWNVPYVYILLIVGSLLMVLFLFVEKRAKNPLVPFEVLTGETGFVLVCIAGGWSCFGIWLYYTFQWAHFVDGDNVIMSAVKVIPSAIAGLCAAATTAVLLSFTGLSAVMVIAMTCFLVGIIIMGTRPIGQIYWAQKFVSLIIQCFGMDMSFPAATIILSNSLPKKRQGIAASLVATFQNYSISIGLGLAGTVQKYKTQNLPLDFATRVKGMRVSFYMGMGLAGLGVLSSLLFLLLQLMEKFSQDKNNNNNNDNNNNPKEIEVSR